MSEPYLGDIKMVGHNFAQRGWAFCDGQLLPISSHEALFSLLGTTYGGDGRTTFALPDLRGRAPIHEGQGPGLSNHRLGSRNGSETNTLTTAQLPSHNHALSASDKKATAVTPNEGVLATGKTDRSGEELIYDNINNPTVALKTTSIGNTGGSQSVNNMMPYITMNFVIALEGIFPPRT